MESNTEPENKSTEPQKKKRTSTRENGSLFGNSKKFDHWEVGTNYKCEKLLGSGSYGQVV
jgi:hypothetical protein